MASSHLTNASTVLFDLRAKNVHVDQPVAYAVIEKALLAWLYCHETNAPSDHIALAHDCWQLVAPEPQPQLMFGQAVDGKPESWCTEVLPEKQRKQVWEALYLALQAYLLVKHWDGMAICDGVYGTLHEGCQVSCYHRLQALLVEEQRLPMPISLADTLDTVIALPATPMNYVLRLLLANLARLLRYPCSSDLRWRLIAPIHEAYLAVRRQEDLVLPLYQVKDTDRAALDIKLAPQEDAVYRHGLREHLTRVIAATATESWSELDWQTLVDLRDDIAY